MNLLQKFIYSLINRPDRLLHFIVGYLVYSISIFITYHVFIKISIYNLSLWSLAIVWIIAISKEIYDKFNGGLFDVVDMTWTILGSIPMFIFINYISE